MRSAAVVGLVVGACGRFGFEAREDDALVDATPTPGATSSLAVGDSHTCAIRGGALYCWGLNAVGQCGVGAVAMVPAPMRVGNEPDWTWISSSNENSCGIRGGELYCWGQNSQGEVGVGPDAGNVMTPARVGTASTWHSVELGEHQACGLQLDGSVWCWGNNDSGEIGVPGPTRQRTPLRVEIGTGWTQILVGYNWTAAIRPGEYRWWGANEEGQRGDGSVVGTNVPPSTVDFGFGFSTISIGFEHACAVDDSGTVRCWGDNRGGQLAAGSPPDDEYAPVVASAPSSPRTLAAGGHSTCAITAEGALVCWGSNDFGELGNGTTAAIQATPVAVGTATDWTSIDVGLDHACGERGSDLYCWGKNNSGQLGIGTQSAMEPIPSGPVQF